MPVNHGRQSRLLFGNLQAHESMGQNEIIENSPRGMNLKIARRQRSEMGQQFLFGDALGQKLPHLLEQRLPLFLLGANKFCSAGHQLHCFMVQGP